MYTATSKTILKKAADGGKSLHHICICIYLMEEFIKKKKRIL